MHRTPASAALPAERDGWSSTRERGDGAARLWSVTVCVAGVGQVPNKYCTDIPTKRIICAAVGLAGPSQRSLSRGL